MSERITVNPDICNGKPVIRGTRITAQTVLEFLAAGDSVEDVLEEYPGLKRVLRHGEMSDGEQMADQGSRDSELQL